MLPSRLIFATEAADFLKLTTVGAFTVRLSMLYLALQDVHLSDLPPHNQVGHLSHGRYLS